MKTTKVKLPTKGDLAADAVVAWCRREGYPEPLREVKFAEHVLGRLWRFDLCWPISMIPQPLALELNGGGWVGGRHNRGSSLEAEYEKLATAAALGFRVMIATHKMLERGDVWPLLEMALSVK